MAELDVLSGKKRRVRLDAIRTACQIYIASSLSPQLSQLVSAVIPRDRFRLEPDPDDKDRQTLLFWYPAVKPTTSDDIRSAVKIESGAKSALDPHTVATVTPYVAQDLPALDLTVINVTTVKPERTFWDKIMILHGLRQWHDSRGELRHGGQRVSRHYYGVHRLLPVAVESGWPVDLALAQNCADHARLFFGSADLGLNLARPGAFTLSPDPVMRDALTRDYEAMAEMVFGEIPTLDEVLASVERFERIVNDDANILA